MDTRPIYVPQSWKVTIALINYLIKHIWQNNISKSRYYQLSVSYFKLLKVTNCLSHSHFRCFFKVRPNKTRRFIFALVGITLISGLSRPWSSLLLYVEKMFGWTLVDYTNYTRWLNCYFSLNTNGITSVDDRFVNYLPIFRS
jgi:hypothetical protein